MKTLISSFFFILQLICIPTSDAQTINRTRLQSRTGPSQIKRDYNGICGLKQSSGWFSMSEAKTSGKMFFWLFDAQVETPKDAPLLLWLQGGPGGAIAPSVLSSHGPCQLDASGKLQKSDWALNKFANVLYVEQPLGTGFSTNDGDTVSEWYRSALNIACAQTTRRARIEMIPFERHCARNLVVCRR